MSPYDKEQKIRRKLLRPFITKIERSVRWTWNYGHYMMIQREIRVEILSLFWTSWRTYFTERWPKNGNHITVEDAKNI